MRILFIWLFGALFLTQTSTASSLGEAAAEAGLALDGLSPEQSGIAIFREADRRESGYQDLTVDLEMILRNARGAESRRNLRIRQLEVPDDGDKLLIIFDSPKPIRGTALLSYAHKVEPDDQWLYLPAAKRVKKITSRNKSGPFLSSEFAYEDLALQEIEKYSYRLIETEQINGEEFLIVERIPVDEYSGYARQVVRLDTTELRIHHISYYDRRNRLLKTLEVDGYRKYADRYWKAQRMLMTNQQTGKSTELRWQNYAFATGLEDVRDFSINSLRRSH